MKKAVIILSGGLDSTTCMGIAQAEGYDLYPITFDYQQRHKIELEKAQEVAKYYNVNEHKIFDLGFLHEIGGSALTNKDIEVPKKGVTNEIPITYVPGRNLIFLSIAASYAEVIGAEAIYIGVNALDYSGYPDCRPNFINSVQETIKLGTKAGVEGKEIIIKTPLLHLTKAEIIQKGMELNVPYHLTTSCYEGEEEACGECDSCRLRLKGFSEAGFTDPIKYKKSK